MTKYEFLLALREKGLLQTLTKEYGLPSYAKWMEYYEFYLDHPKLSFTELSFYFQASRCTIYRALLQRPRRKLQLSYAEYYERYHTTEERDGWKMANPTGRQVIYVKPA